MSAEITLSPLSDIPRRRRAELADCLEAFAYLAICRAAVRLLPFAWVVGWMKGGTATALSSDLAVGQSIQAIERVERRIFWKSRCLDRGMALQWMLKRRGIASQLVYGLASKPAALKAHVWVDVDGQTVMGAVEADDYCEVARFPPSPVDHQSA